MTLILSRFLPFAKAFKSFVNTFSVHSFPPVYLHQHFPSLCCSFPQFVAELDICTLLHRAVILPLTLTTFDWPQSVCSACCVSILMSLKNHTHARIHSLSCRSDIIPFTEFCCRTLYINIKIKSVALQPRRTKTDWKGCCQMTVQGALWLAKRLSLNFNFSFLNRISLPLIHVATQLSSRGWVDPVPDPILAEKFLGYNRESNPGPLGWQSDVLATIPNRWSAYQYDLRNF